MATKSKVIFARAPEATEENLYANVINAAKAGQISMDPMGDLALTLTLPRVHREIDGASRTLVPTPQADLHSFGDFDALESALRTTGGKIAAYRALGCEMRSVPAALQFRARALAKMLAIVGESDEAPRDFIDSAAPLVETWMRRAATGAEAWMFVLEGIFACPLMPVSKKGTRGPSKLELEQIVDDILARLRASSAEAPAAFLKPTAEQRTEAAKSLRKTRVTHGKPGGGVVAPWGAAKRFADAFGVPMQSKKRDVLRERKSTKSRAR